MLVPITGNGGDCPEWAMIELQGEIQLKPELQAQALLEVGTLCAKGADAVQLTVGYHQLEGKRMPLKKPYAILDKQCSSAADGDGVSGTQQQGGQSPSFQVVGIVRSKYLFKTRPKAMISKPK